MDIEFDLQLRALELERLEIAEAVRGLPRLEAVTQGDLLVLRSGCARLSASIEEALMDFLRSIGNLRQIISKSEGVVRVGVFFSSSEVAVFCVDLSAPTISALFEFGVGLSIYGYPCSD